MFKQLVAWSCNSCSIAPLTDYINNPVYQELPTQNECFNSADERIYLNLRTSYGYTKEMEKLERKDSKLALKIELKNATRKKYRTRIWGYSMGENLHILTKDGLTLYHKTYSFSSTANDFE